jgi:hypothetical protein
LSLALVGVTALLFLAPAAQAASAGASTITLRAPYAGVTTYTSTSTSSSGCGVAKIPHGPNFSGTTGKGGFSASARATSCDPLLGDSGASSVEMTVLVPVPVYSGHDVIHASWTVGARVSSLIGGANCNLSNSTYSYCYVDASASFGGYAYLVDLTNGSYWFGPTNWAGTFAESTLYNYCYLGNCSLEYTGNTHVVVNTPVTWSFSARGLNPNDSFALEFIFYGYVSVYDVVYQGTLSGASESASIAMAGNGLGATLNSITIR